MGFGDGKGWGPGVLSWDTNAYINTVLSHLHFSAASIISLTGVANIFMSTRLIILLVSSRENTITSY